MQVDAKGLLFWAIMFFSQAAFGQVTFVIESLPKATPLNDTIYISGTFNNWNTNDPAYRLKKRLDGKYTATLPRDSGTIEYKFTRGGWLKTETNEKNEYRPNRSFTYGNNETIYITIPNWQDLGGAQPFDFFALYFFAISFQGVICLFLLYRIKNNKESLTNPLALWIGVISILLFGRGIYEIVSTNWQIYLASAAQIIVFTTGPVFFFIGKEGSLTTKTVLRHFSPALMVLILVIMKSINFTPLQFLSYSLFANITIDQFISHGLGAFHNLVYLLAFAKLRYSEYAPLVSYSVLIKSFILTGWLLNFYLITTGGWQHYFLIKFDLPLLLLSFQILLLTWLTIKKPEFFKTKDRSIPTPEIEKLKEIIHRVMTMEKPYCKSDLSLNELSEIVCIKPHLLSKVINEGFNHNFRDFVNKYRVEEFIRHVNSDHYKNYTYLAVAYEVGFNAKSTFNVAFKRFTKVTPREYFKNSNSLNTN
ncbi:putative alpha-dextrin endo-1, 6-alpha-glucosidase [Fulvivirga imtechensis AK7]|uniref:Putative alpha-dextrin endo-1, 6-alpha-glucosidase n=1 Tax=Fulvivirga imtechensis AK7 TaxID=1237149 RepID=L8K000_9BACT|nr:helix-turn-helix domain-containing protein [Fulvivirga imtechensis]ELR73249.1 putative alpha-dextrin endo-1, 6-alpha-glucosidase [Fulvivirga imtechensis AK7]